jgi:hypothetical protein
MSFISWFTEPELISDSARTEHRPRREPMHSRPSLENLEERTLLDASTGLVEGSFHNLNLNNNFNFGSNGIVLPMQNLSGPTTNGAMGSNGDHAVDPSGRVSSGTLAQASSAAQFAQNQPDAQFRIFGINSQGNNPQLSQSTTAFILRDAFGFGSGTQPDAPWKPNAYNLGLANRQPDYSTQTANGFPSAAPWARQWSSPVAQTEPGDENSPLNPDQSPSINQDEEPPQTPEQRTAHRSMLEQEQTKLYTLDLDVRDMNDDLKALIDQQSSDNKPPIEASMPADGTLPDSLWLSALAPAPMVALVAGFPGIAPEGGEATMEVGGDAGASE